MLTWQCICWLTNSLEFSNHEDQEQDRGDSPENGEAEVSKHTVPVSESEALSCQVGLGEPLINIVELRMSQCFITVSDRGDPLDPSEPGRSRCSVRYEAAK